ncbi:IS256 family transposase [Fibrobacterota bacterium]
MKEDTKNNNIIQLETLSLEETVKIGAQRMLAAAIESEIKAYMSQYTGLLAADGRQAVVRNGNLPARTISSCYGPVEVVVPRSRSRVKDVEPFSSTLIPKYLRKTMKLEDAIPYFYLGGLSNGDFIPCFEKLFGPAVKGLSSPSITRMKKAWLSEMEKWNKRDLSRSKYCYIWVDGIHFNLRLEDSRLCVLVVIGARENGEKELIAVSGGYRESSESWRCLLRDLKDRGMPCFKLAIGDGALGFWKAVRDIYPKAEWQRCWVHKTANILDKLPKSVQPRAKSMIHEMYRAEKEKDARSAYNRFIKQFSSKYPKAVECLTKDEKSLFTFYSFPADHWQHIRSTNVIESTFATVRLRTTKTRGQGTMDMTLAMVFKLAERASKRWQRLRGYKFIRKVIRGADFRDGVEQKKAA